MERETETLLLLNELDLVGEVAHTDQPEGGGA